MRRRHNCASRVATQMPPKKGKKGKKKGAKKKGEKSKPLPQDIVLKGIFQFEFVTQTPQSAATPDQRCEIDGLRH